MFLRLIKRPDLLEVLRRDLDKKKKECFAQCEFTWNKCLTECEKIWLLLAVLNKHKGEYGLFLKTSHSGRLAKNPFASLPEAMQFLLIKEYQPHNSSFPKDLATHWNAYPPAS